MKDNNLILLPWYISCVNSFDFMIDWMYVFNKPVLQNTCIDTILFSLKLPDYFDFVCTMKWIYMCKIGVILQVDYLYELFFQYEIECNIYFIWLFLIIQFLKF